jgi:hypothetical protein
MADIGDIANAGQRPGQAEETPSAPNGALTLDDGTTIAAQPTQTDTTTSTALDGSDALGGARIEPLDLDNDEKGNVPDARRKGQLPQPSLQGRVYKASELKKADTTRKPGNKWALGIGTALAGLLGGGGGAVGGSAAGAALGAKIGGGLGAAALAWTGPVGIVVGGSVGALIGAGVGAAIGGLGAAYAGWKLADYCFWSPQGKHLDEAKKSLESKYGGGFTEKQKENLEDVSDDDWRTLLHVPSSKLFGSGQVAGKDNRQAIRRDLVEYIAANGADRAAAERHKELMIGKYAFLAKTKGREKAFVGEMSFGLGDRNHLIDELGLRGALPDDIDDKIDRLAAEHHSAPDLREKVRDRLLKEAIGAQRQRLEALPRDLGLDETRDVPEGIHDQIDQLRTEQWNPDLEKQVGRLLVEQAAEKAAGSNSKEQQARAAGAIVAYEARHTTDPRAFLQGDYAGRQALGRMFKQQEFFFQLPEGISKRMDDAAEELLGLNRREGLERRAGEAIYQLNEMMPKITGRDGLSDGQDKLLKAMAETARREAEANHDLGNPQTLAREAVRAAFVPYLVDLLSETAERVGEKQPRAKASLIASNKLVALAFSRGKTFGRREAAANMDREPLAAWGEQRERVKAAVESKYNDADRFLDRIASGRARAD